MGRERENASAPEPERKTESLLFELVNQKTGIMERVAELLMGLIAWKQLQSTFSQLDELFTSPLNTALFVCNHASFARIHLSKSSHFPLSGNAEKESETFVPHSAYCHATAEVHIKPDIRCCVWPLRKRESLATTFLVHLTFSSTSPFCTPLWWYQAWLLWVWF